MRFIAPPVAGIAMLGLAACEPGTYDTTTLLGAAAGAGAGYIAADVLEADDDWRIIATLGGAAAGTVVARNLESEQCAYSRGDGTYYTAPCP